MRIFVVLMLIAIIASLGSALVFIYRDQGQDKTRAVKALTCASAFPLSCLLLLMAAHRFGWIGERLIDSRLRGARQAIPAACPGLQPIDDDEQAEPDDVDEVPVPGNRFEGEMSLRGEVPLHCP
jgi:hypothetical protein